MTGRNRLQEPHLFQKNLLLFSKKSQIRLAGTAKFVLLSPETSTTLTFFYKNFTISYKMQFTTSFYFYGFYYFAEQAERDVVCNS